MKITNLEGIILRLPERQAVAGGTQDENGKVVILSIDSRGGCPC